MDTESAKYLFCHCLKEQGFDESTILMNIMRINAIETYLADIQIGTMDRQSISIYMDDLEKRLKRGKIAASHYRNVRCTANRFISIIETGNIEFTMGKRDSKYRLTTYYFDILVSFVKANKWTDGTCNSYIWACRRLFAWLQQQDCHDINNVNAEMLQEFIAYTSRGIAITSLSLMKLCLKQFFWYLKDSGITTNDFELFFSIPVATRKKIQRPIAKEDVAILLSAINRASEKGKRDYAILLLGIVTGMRMSDIAGLKLSDIDWKNGEIRIIQAKSGTPLILPLTSDVGIAIQDYILNGRPYSECEHIFLRTVAPIIGITNRTIDCMFRKLVRENGVKHYAFDGMTFHSLRRAVGLNMVENGVPVTEIAQILGHRNINTTKQYISLDSRHLKLCALDFAGIKPKGERYV